MSHEPLRTSEPLVWRDLDAHDRDDIIALHRLSTKGLTSMQVKPERPEFFDHLLGGGGRIIGARDASGALAAYGVLQYAPDPGTDPNTWMGWPANTPVQKLAGAAVAPDLRGGGLQLELIRRRMALAGPDICLYATVAPGNPASWRNMLQAGFDIRAMRPCYGGVLRYLLARDARGMHAPVRNAETGLYSIEDTPLEAQSRLFQQGWRGVALDSEPPVRYCLVACQAEVSC